MTTNILPEEVLLIIFDLVDDTHEANVFQRVCRAWYRPAHITFLQNVDLCDSDKLNQFIRSIDYNPIPLYLKAIKKITVSDIEGRANDNKSLLTKLFFRFPNLEDVSLNNATTVLHCFDKELRQEFLQKCPKNVLFSLGPCTDKSQYGTALSRVKTLVTEIDEKYLSGDIAALLSYYPRLNSIKGDKKNITNFEKCLPVIDEMHHPRRIALKNIIQDNAGFAERYLASKSKEQQAQLVEKLSKVETLHWRIKRFCESSLEFIEKYLTGLKQLEISYKLDRTWDHPQSRDELSFNAALGILRSKRNCKLNLLVKYYVEEANEAVTYVVQHIETHVLQLSLMPSTYEVFNTSHGGFAMSIESSRPGFMDISSADPPYVPYDLFTIATPLVSINEFVLKIRNGRQNQNNITVEDYQIAFEAMPSLKKATLDIPIHFPERRVVEKSLWQDEEEEEEDSRPQVYSDYRDQKALCLQLESLTLQATPYGEMQVFLDKCPYMLPNLKNLNIYYHCGVWKKSLGTFQMELGEYSLEKLTLDVTPVKMLMKKHLKKEQFTNDDFFVVALEFTNSEEKHLYQISFDLSTVTKIIANDLGGVIRGKDYLRVSITVANLKHLELLMYRYSIPDEENENYLDVGKYTTQLVVS